MRIPYKQIIAAVAMSGIAGLALAQSVSFLAPADGATVSSPFKVQFAVNGMEVKPAGVMDANTGHHHLLINADPVKAGEVVPTDEHQCTSAKARPKPKSSCRPANTR